MTRGTFSATAQTGFFSADNYDAHRPSYDAEAVSDLLHSVGVAGKQGATILDLAAGTGKFTAVIATREEGYNIIAVEPHEQMLATLTRKNLPRVSAKEGTAYSIPLEDSSVDAVIVAQAFHWFAKIDVLREISRVLHPNGSLGLVWNVEDYNQIRSFPCVTAWESALSMLNWKNTRDSDPRFKHEQWRVPFTEDQSEPGPMLFRSPLMEKSFRRVVWLSKEVLWKRFNTLSNIANLSPSEKKELREEFDSILETSEVQRNEGGKIAVHTTCIIAWIKKA